MAHTQCALFRENIPAYALAALDSDEAAALETHLQTCVACRDELAAYRAVSDNLLMALPPQSPPAALRRRLQGRLSAAQKAPRPRLAWSLNQLALGMAFVLLLGLNVFSILQVRALQRQQAQLARQIQTGQTALAMLSYPDAQTLPINGQGIAGTLLLDKDRSVAVLIVWDLPPLAENQTYQIWLIDPKGNRSSAGLFRPEAGQPFTTESILSAQNLTNFTGIGVTVEPAGGSSHPTGPRLFKVDF